jgi:hypothetical protein
VLQITGRPVLFLCEGPINRGLGPVDKTPKSEDALFATHPGRKPKMFGIAVLS